MPDRVPLTRFVVDIQGQLKRLVSIREAANGRLIIKTTIEGTHALRNGAWDTIENLKHTVHPSGRSETNANLIHGTTVFSSGGTAETHLLTHAVRDDRLQPIYARRVLDLSDGEPPDIRAKDRVFSLGPYDPRKCVLLYQLWVTSRRAAFRFPMSIHYGLHTALFGDFAICLPYCFAPGASDAHGNFKTYGTSSEGRLSPEALAVGHIAGKLSEGAQPHKAIATIIADFKEMATPMRMPLGSWSVPAFTPSSRWWSGHSVPFSAKPELCDDPTGEIRNGLTPSH